jgi:hypothetical protein
MSSSGYGYNRVSEYFYWQHVVELRKLYNRLTTATNQEGQHLSWQRVMIRLIHGNGNNFLYSFKEHCAAIYYSLLSHTCHCNSIECRNHRPHGRRPDAKLERLFRGVINQFNNDPVYYRFEITAGPRYETRRKTGEQVITFRLGIVDNLQDLEAARQRAQNIMNGWNNKMARFDDIGQNITEVRRQLRREEQIIDAFLNGRS